MHPGGIKENGFNVFAQVIDFENCLKQLFRKTNQPIIKLNQIHKKS